MSERETVNVSPHPGENTSRILLSWVALAMFGSALLAGSSALGETARFPFIGWCALAALSFAAGSLVLAMAIWCPAQKDPL